MLKIQFAKRYPWDLHKAVILKLYASPKLFHCHCLSHSSSFLGFPIHLSISYRYTLRSKLKEA